MTSRRTNARTPVKDRLSGVVHLRGLARRRSDSAPRPRRRVWRGVSLGTVLARGAVATRRSPVPGGVARLRLRFPPRPVGHPKGRHSFVGGDDVEPTWVLDGHARGPSPHRSSVARIASEAVGRSSSMKESNVAEEALSIPDRTFGGAIGRKARRAAFRSRCDTGPQRAGCPPPNRVDITSNAGRNLDWRVR